MPIVALITDFGTTDWFVGEMKGAMLSAEPGITIIDITHDIPFGEIRRAAFILATSFRSFPKGTVFCVVVDPGVGSNRSALAIETHHYRFVGPDNGVLSWATGRDGAPTIHHIDNSNLLRDKTISSTFHGRDVFGPVAALLAAGLPIARTGTGVNAIEQLPFPDPRISSDCVTSEILAIDRFGNIITSIDESILPRSFYGRALRFGFAHGERLIRHGTFFQSVPEGEPLWYSGSGGFIEIGINGGSAAERFGLGAGDRVEITPG
jgi:S-adenosylmethionine hydrolase